MLVEKCTPEAVQESTYLLSLIYKDKLTSLFTDQQTNCEFTVTLYLSVCLTNWIYGVLSYL